MAKLAKVFSAELEGIDARCIEVEVDLHVGLHAFNIVGLADKAVSEAKERVNSALKNSNVKPPTRENRKITVNLAPADIKKAGSHYDLAIAIGYLLATEQMKPVDASKIILVGELALDGTLRPIHGALSFAEMAAREGFARVMLPEENAAEASAISGIEIYPAHTLLEAIDILEGTAEPRVITREQPQKEEADLFSAIRGQASAKRALIIAAAGGHNLLMVGSPGAGKSMMAKSLISILPPLHPKESVEITKIWSAAGLNTPGNEPLARPFRAPHHNASAVAIVGGGTNPKPGEISLAHRGILFLDELPEFRRDILESLRQPLEEGVVLVARAKRSLRFPANFTLIAAMNPCPCGYFGDEEKECRCSANEVFRYQKKISGPLLDRIDLQLSVPRLSVEELRSPRETSGENETVSARAAVRRAREIQQARLATAGLRLHTNSEMGSKEVEELVTLLPEAEVFLKSALEKSFISARGYYRVLKVARTIADLAESEKVTKDHLAEAFGYRMKGKD